MRFIALSLALIACGTARPVNAPSTDDATDTFRTDTAAFDLEAGGLGRGFQIDVPMGASGLFFEATVATGTIQLDGFEGVCEVDGATLYCSASFPAAGPMVVSVTSPDGATGVQVAWEVSGIRDAGGPRVLFDGDMSFETCRSFTTPDGAYGALVVDSDAPLTTDWTFDCGGADEDLGVDRCRADQQGFGATYEICTGDAFTNVQVVWHPAEILADYRLAAGEEAVYNLEADDIVQDGVVSALGADIQLYNGPFLVEQTVDHLDFTTGDEAMQIRVLQSSGYTTDLVIASFDGLPEVLQWGFDFDGDTIEDASNIPEDEGEQGVFGSLHPRDIDVFRLPEGTYTVHTTGTTDTMGDIVDEHGIVLQNDDDSGEGTNFSMEVTVEPGQARYLRVTGYDDRQVGDYTLFLAE